MLESEAGREELREELLGGLVAGTGIEDEGLRKAELKQSLPAGTAGLGGGLVEVGDRHGKDANVRAVLAYCPGDGGLLGAGGEAEGGVFDVAAGDDGGDSLISIKGRV